METLIGRGVIPSFVEPFVGRRTELERLQKRYTSPKPELIVIYGRRRIGKSELVRQSLEGIEGVVYYQAAETTPAIQLDTFVERASAIHPGITEIREDWESLLGYLAEQGAVVVIDEFPYLIESDASIPSRFQRVWDERFPGTSGSLVLIGSSISIMEERVLSGGSPLHGRRTASVDLAPLSPGEARSFYPDYGPEESVVAWSVFGGTPYYLQQLDPECSARENIASGILSPHGLLHDEPRFLLRAEIHQPSTYFGILDAMASGNRERNDIAQAAGVDASSVGSYLAKLALLRVIARDVPVTEDPSRSRKGRYRISDPLFRFWFRFVHGRQGEIETMGSEAQARIVEPELPRHASEAFEELCHRALPHLVPAPYTRVGRWWYGEHEVDVVGLTQGRDLVLGEARFRSEPVGRDLLGKLEGLVSEVRWTPQGGGPAHPVYALFSRSGFTAGLEHEASERSDVHLFTLEDVWRALG